MNLHFSPSPNPSILAWARREGGWPVERTAKRLGLPPNRVTEWENGDRYPTVRQLTELARFYQRPLSLFYQQEPPRTVPLSSEYRRLRNVRPGQESPELRLAVRHMLARRQAFLDLMDELGYEAPLFTLSARSNEDPRSVGERLRAATGITLTRQQSWKSGWQAWREWRAALEDIGIMVFMFPKVELAEVRGIALLRKPMPVAAVNTKESVVEARPFSALHEVVHLMLANAHEEEPALTDKHTPQSWELLERFAERAASYALIDEASLRDIIGAEGTPTSIEAIRVAANRFKVTPMAFATRLRESGYLNVDEYGDWYRRWTAFARGVGPRKGGFATPVSKTLGQGGRTFAQLVLEAFDTNRITISEAARHLNLRADRFEELRGRLSEGTVSVKGDE